MEDAVIPPHVAVMAPILTSEAVMTLKSARFLISVFRAFAAKHAAKSGLKELKIDAASFNLQRAYAHAETLVEVRIMVMLSLAGVVGVLWLLDVPSGRTMWLVESAYTTTVQLFVHLIISFASVFAPDFIAGKLIQCSEYPPTLLNIVIVLLLIADACAHVANAAFLAAAIRNKMIAAGMFVLSVLLYKVIDKGLLTLGNALRIKIEREERALAVADEQENIKSIEEELLADEPVRDNRRNKNRNQQQHGGKKKKKN